MKNYFKYLLVIIITFLIIVSIFNMLITTDLKSIRIYIGSFGVIVGVLILNSFLKYKEKELEI